MAGSIIAIAHRKSKEKKRKFGIAPIMLSMQREVHPTPCRNKWYMHASAYGRSQGEVFKSPSTGADSEIKEMGCCGHTLLLRSRCLSEESEETSGGGADEAELDGERASGAVAELLVARVGVAALAGGGGTRRRGGQRARSGGASGGDGAVVLGEGSGDGCCVGRGGSGGDFGVGGEGGRCGGRGLGDGALDSGLDSLRDRAGGSLSAGGSALSGAGNSGGGDN